MTDEMRPQAKIGLAVLAALAITLPAAAQSDAARDATTDSFEAWDRNTDANIDVDEWNVQIEGRQVFARYDADSDGKISREEFEARFGKAARDDAAAAETTGSVGSGGLAFSDRFADASFTAWDADRDGTLTPDEFHAGVRKGYDVSGDNRIDRNEWVDVDRETRSEQ